MNKKHVLAVIAASIIIFVIAFSGYRLLNSDSEVQIEDKKAGRLDVSNQEPFSIADPEVDLVRDGVNAGSIEFGCSGADCIPSIDEPVFESKESADQWLEPDDLVFTVKKNGVFRAYPQRILNWHEIVNDEIEGEPVAVTFCPLCGSALAFKRTIEGEPAEFGVSGRLLNNNLIMYDRNSGNLWQQETGEVIVGDLVEKDLELEPFSIGTTDWETWSSAHPQTEVLSRTTGYQRDYDRYPYGTYEEDGRLLFGLENEDDRLDVKAPGFGFEVDDYDVFFTEEAVKNVGRKDLGLDGVNGVVVSEEDGTVFIELVDGARITPLRTFWFAWAAFHPDSVIVSE